MNSTKRNRSIKHFLAIVALATFISTFTIYTNDVNLKIENYEQSSIDIQEELELAVKPPIIEEPVQTSDLEAVVAVPEPETIIVPPAPVKTVPKPVAVATDGTCEQYRHIISQYSWNVEVAMNVCKAESSGNTYNENLNDYHDFAKCRGSFGLFQINCSHGRVFDAEKNIAIAHSMYVASGWGPWSFHTCKVVVKCY